MSVRLAFPGFALGNVWLVGGGPGDSGARGVRQITPTPMIDRALPRAATAPGG